MQYVCYTLYSMAAPDHRLRRGRIGDHVLLEPGQYRRHSDNSQPSLVPEVQVAHSRYAAYRVYSIEYYIYSI